MASDERNRQSKPPKPKVTAPGHTRAQSTATASTQKAAKGAPKPSVASQARGPNPAPGRRQTPAERDARDAERLAARQAAANRVPEIHFPEALPVSGRREEIARAIAGHQVVIVSGETGSGKTTQLPKICLALGRGLGAGGTGLIGHTQPRRIAASATARRIADE
ncbi:MAG: ATP-dependent helicase, partial [Pandoraea sp.]|nr:ATP-dependent helicase [Pandoraea sp.]